MESGPLREYRHITRFRRLCAEQKQPTCTKGELTCINIMNPKMLKCQRYLDHKSAKLRQVFSRSRQSRSMRLPLYHDLGLDCGPNFRWHYIF